MTTPAAKVIHTDPTKDFFVKMITRDIDLRDCIFDLLDNAIDGARRFAVPGDEKPFRGRFAHITLDRTDFQIEDNCGGIRLSDAIDYAFHFGRRADSPNDVSGGIGLYGIGMKRAIFKIGRRAEVISEADDACFRVDVNVPEWEKKADWDFAYEESLRSGTNGTKIKVSSLNAGVDSSFADPVFVNQLIRRIARDYAFLIAKGFEIKVGTQIVPMYSYGLRANEQLQPASVTYRDEGVTVRIVAGLIDELPDDIPDDLTPDKVERYGWSVICNDRVVLAFDKTDRTIWGHDNFRVWHPQYNGFAGFAFFEANDQRALPWTTTKREVDTSSPLYRRALSKLKEITEEFIAYTNRRKEDIPAAKEAEKQVERVDVYSAREERALTLPAKSSVTAGPPQVNITYKRNLSEIDEIRKHLNDRALSYREVGIMTFDYYMEVELGK
jgi:hypothetical protein